MSPDRPRHRTFKVAALLLMAALAATIMYGHFRAARLVSGALTNYFGLPVTVRLIDLGIGSGVTFAGISVENPPGYAERYLASIKSINIKPDYRALMSGEVSIESVRINGPEIIALQDGGGRWNISAALESYKKGKKEPAKRAREFSVGVIELSGGRISLPGKGRALQVRKAELRGLSNRAGESTSFYLEADDSKTARVEASGSASLFSDEPEIRARMAASVDRIGQYLSGTASENLKDASGDAALEVALKGAAARASVEGSVRKIGAARKTRSGGLGADFHATLSYDRKTDAVLIESAGIKVPEYGEVGINGRLNNVSGNLVGNICFNTSEIDLAVLNPFLPPNLNVGGSARLDDVCVKGPLRPFSAEARGRLAINGLSTMYNGKGFSGAFGGATVKFAAGRLSGRSDFRLIGGGLTGGFGYGKDGGSFRLSAIKLSLSSLEGLPEGLSGTVDADIEGTLSPGLKSLRTKFEASAAGLDYGGRFTAGSVTAAGDAVKDEKGLTLSGKVHALGLAAADRGVGVSKVGVTVEASAPKGKFSAAGTLKAAGIAYRGRTGGALSCSYSYTDGGATLGGLSYGEEGLSAKFEHVAAAFSGGNIKAKAEGGGLSYGNGLAVLEGLEAALELNRTQAGGIRSADIKLRAGNSEAYGLALTDAALSAVYDGETADAKLGLKISGNPVSIAATAKIDSSGLKKHYLSGNLDVKELASLAPAFDRAGLKAAPTAGSLSASFKLDGDGGRWRTGSGSVELSGLSMGSVEKTWLSGVSARLSPSYEDRVLTLPRTGVDFGGYFTLNVSGSATKGDEGWSAKANAALPRTGLSVLQEGVLEALPPGLMWADVSGEAGAELGAVWSKSGGTSIEGSVELSRAGLTLPDIGLSIGPAQGRIPIGIYFGGGGVGKTAPPVFRGEVFDREHYPQLVRSYSAVPDDADIVIDKIRYGFVELDAVTLALTPGEGWYDIDWFGFYAFKGQLVGYGRADLAGGKHALSLILSGFSLKELCDTAPGIKDYLSGRVDGLARIVFKGKGYEGVTGASMFWAKDGPDEDREISKEFIKKLMGSSVKKYMSLFIGDRYFDTGELEIVFSKGNLVFEKLLIENTNFLGQKDLYITVAPVSNRISIEHLLEVIRDVGARAKGM